MILMSHLYSLPFVPRGQNLPLGLLGNCSQELMGELVNLGSSLNTLLESAIQSAAESVGCHPISCRVGRLPSNQLPRQ